MKLKNCLKNGFTLISILVIVAIIGLLAIFAPPGAKADSQGLPYTPIYPSNFPAAVIPAQSQTTNTYMVIPIRNGQGAALEWQGWSGAAQTSSFAIFPSIDGTNISTTPSYTWSFPVTNSTSVNPELQITNWSAQQLTGLRALIVSNQTVTGSATVSNDLFQATRPND